LDRLDYESMARVLFTLTLPTAALIPLLSLGPLLPSGTPVAWNDKTVWVSRQRIARSRIRRVALVPRQGQPSLEILVSGWSQALVYSVQPIWIAGVLERLGYRIEFSEKPISEPIRLFRRRTV
jgi:hypothetical protein